MSDKEVLMVKTNRHTLRKKRPEGRCIFCDGNKSDYFVDVQTNNFRGDDECFPIHGECYKFIMGQEGVK